MCVRDAQLWRGLVTDCEVTWRITSKPNRQAAPAGTGDAATKGAGWLQALTGIDCYHETRETTITAHRTDWLGGGLHEDSACILCICMLIYTEQLFPQRCWASFIVCLAKIERRVRVCNSGWCTTVIRWDLHPVLTARGPSSPWRCRKVFLPLADMPLWRYTDS